MPAKLNLPEKEIQPYIAKLADIVAETVDDAAVDDAFRNVPRHRFVMEGFHAPNDETQRFEPVVFDENAPQDWLDIIYSNRVLMVELWETGAPSSSSEPVLMAQMLAALDIHAGMKVLEIGTGTGYNAALLAHLVSDKGEVVTIDNQAQLTERAAKILHDMFGERVTVKTGDGLEGVPESAPYDRIIATAGHERVPVALIDQLALNGKLIMNVGSGGGLIVLEKSKNGVSGHFLEQHGYFMPLLAQHSRREEILKDVDIDSMRTMSFRFFINWVLPHVNFYPMTSADNDTDAPSAWRFQSDNLKLTVHSESDGDQIKLVLTGDDNFVQDVANIIRLWHEVGKPQRSDFMLIVKPDGQQVIRIRGVDDFEYAL